MQQVRSAASIGRCASVGVAHLASVGVAHLVPGRLCHRGAICVLLVVTEPVHRNDTGTVALQSLTQAHMGTFLLHNKALRRATSALCKLHCTACR